VATAATLPAVFVGLLAGFLLRGKPGSSSTTNSRLLVLSSVAGGMTAWYFLDIMAASTFLGINQGLTNATLLLVLLFLLGFLATIMLEPSPKSNRLYDPIFLAAGIIGLHGIGEGIAIGSILISAIDPIAAVGGPLSAASFVIHKGLEAFIVSSLAVGAGEYYSHILAAGLIVGAPTVIGAIAGYVFAPNDTIFFALGAGGTLWLLSTLFASSMTMPSRFKWSLALVAGVMLMFLAGILHSIR
jgi:zinc transporter ZupT